MIGGMLIIRYQVQACPSYLLSCTLHWKNRWWLHHLTYIVDYHNHKPSKRTPKINAPREFSTTYHFWMVRRTKRETIHLHGQIPGVDIFVWQVTAMWGLESSWICHQLSQLVKTVQKSRTDTDGDLKLRVNSWSSLNLQDLAAKLRIPADTFQLRTSAWNLRPNSPPVTSESTVREFKVAWQKITDLLPRNWALSRVTSSDRLFREPSIYTECLSDHQPVSLDQNSQAWVVYLQGRRNPPVGRTANF